MSAEKFLELVKQTGLVDEAVLAKLRKQAGEKKTPEALAQTLVRNGLLTKAQAARLLGQLSSLTEADVPRAKEPRKPASRPNETIDEELGLAPLDDEPDLGLAPDEEQTKAEDEDVVLLEDASGGATQDLGLAPLEEATVVAPAPTAGRRQPAPESAGLRPLEEPAGLTPWEGPASPKRVEPVRGLQPLEAAAGLQPLDEAAGLQPLDAGSLVADDLQPVSGTLQKAERPVKKFRKGSQWDSTLMYVGGGGLVLMLIGGVVLWYTLTRGSASELLEAADKDYRSGSYSQAIPKYEKFLDSYPEDPNVSLARVRIGIARIRQVLEGSKDKQPALKLTGEILPQLENEPAFETEGRPELASVLPEIAEGFSQSAKLEPDMKKAQALVDLAEQAQKLVNNPAYIPTSLRKSVESRIENIQEDIELAKRNINQSKRLDEAVAAIGTKAAAGDTGGAYEERRKLLSEYPGLEANARLVQAVGEITQREKSLVKVENQPVKAVAEDRQPASEFRVALASRRGAGKSGSEQQMVFFLARGAVYGLQASTGHLKWRRAVGADTLANPQPLSRQPGADVIVVDGRNQELLRLKGDSGQLVWRTPLGEAVAEPVVKGSQIFVSTQGKRVLEIDAETGNVVRQALIPQRLSVGPGVSDKGHFYQVGEHSNLYVLDEATLECKEVFYLGHKPGTVAAPPVMALGLLFIADNSGENYSDLHVLATDANGLSLKPAIKPIRLEGRVLVPLIQTAARVIVTTDLGAIRVLEVNTANAKQPVADIVEAVVASYKSPVTAYPVFDGGRLWVGSDRFTKYDVQTSRNRLNRHWIKDERDSFVAPPQAIGETIYHLRRRKDSPAFTAAAIQGDDGKALWEVDLAVPASLLAVDMQRKLVHSISAQAEMFELTLEVLQAGVVDQPATAAGGAARGKPFSEVQELDQGRWALASPQDRTRVVIYDPSAATPSARLREVFFKAAGTAQVTATPSYCNGGLVAPLDNGQVLLIDPASGDNKVLPFQPPVEAGSKVAWRRAAAVGTEQREFVIADDRRKLFRVGVKDQPQPHLEALAQAQLEVDIVSPLAAAGDTVYGVTRGPNSDTVLSFAAADLAVGKEFPVEGRVAWGPEPLGDLVLVATDRQKLLALQTGQTQRWTSPLAYGPLVGRPLRGDGNLVLASLSGTVWMISAQDGKEVAKADVGEPLGAGPVAFGPRLLLSTADGTLLVIGALKQ